LVPKKSILEEPQSKSISIIEPVIITSVIMSDGVYSLLVVREIKTERRTCVVSIPPNNKVLYEDLNLPVYQIQSLFRLIKIKEGRLRQHNFCC
jgi:hypothetical protein